jgi:hypothetical protein
VDHVGIADAVVASAPGRDREQRVQGQLALPAVVGVQTGRQLQGAGKTGPARLRERSDLRLGLASEAPVRRRSGLSRAAPLWPRAAAGHCP